MVLWLLACGAPSLEAPAELSVCDDPDQRAALASDIETLDVPACLHTVWASQRMLDNRWTSDRERQLIYEQVDQVNRLFRGAPEAEYMEAQLDTGIRLVASRVQHHVDADRARMGELDSAGRAEGLEAMALEWNEPGCANVYVLFDDDLTYEGAWAGYPGQLDANAIVAVRDPTPRMMAHEWGHAFGLRHTHEDTWGAEWEGDCSETGDRLCDTAPDPGWDHCVQYDRKGATNAESRSFVECDVGYERLAEDVPLDNLMSYWNPPWASQGFSDEQAETMLCRYANGEIDVLDASI